MRKVSSEVNIPNEDFGPNPFLSAPGGRRAAAEEEAARDLVKHPRQLLADIHDESLAPRPEFVARTLARMASMQLRVQEEVEKQGKATEELNRKVATLTAIGLFIAVPSLVFGAIQAITGILSLCKR